MKKRLGSFILAVCLLLSSFPFLLTANAEDSYEPGSYLVTADGGTRLYATFETSIDFKTTAVKGAYLNVIKVAGHYGYTVFDSVYGWIDLRNDVAYVDSMPTITGGRIEGAKGLTVTRLPDKTVYIEGEESAEIDGLTVALIFDDEQESQMEVTGYTVAFPNLDTYGEKTVTVYYGGFSTQFPITVAKVPVTGIVLTLPVKTAYVEGEPVSFDGMTVTAYFSDGRDDGKGIVLDRSQYVISGVQEGDTTLTPGTHSVIVTYLYPEISASFSVYVSEKNVVDLKLNKLPANPTLYQGQTFRNEDFELIATYDNGLTETITDFNIEYNNQQVGTFTARIYYMDRYVAFDYTVLPLEEVGIAVGDVTYVGNYVGGAVDFSNLKVYLVYNSGEKKLLTDGYQLEHSINPAVEGQYPVKVIYGDFSAVFMYTVSRRKEIIAGDVNFNGKVEAVDARLALRFSAQLEDLSEDAQIAADVDFNDKVTASDARKILRVAAGIDRFGYE